MSEVLSFIDIFKSPSNDKLFTECACYWFACILHERFEGYIIYNPDTVHFATWIDGNAYDITGIIEDLEGYRIWETYKESDRDIVIDNCITMRGAD